MSSAAKKFAVGDFSVRVKVNSDDEIGELATAFNYMADSLSSSEGMRRSFISNVSHELKTPMTTIAGFIDGMLDGTIPPERHDHYMKIVSNEVKRLSRLVTSMLSLSRIDRGELKVNRQKFDMFSLIITILASYEQKIIARKLHITGLEDFRSIVVDADPDLMYQVVYNLIENAVKFTNEGGTIHFGVEETRYDVSVSISNTGPGIPPEDIRYIFDRFYKTDKSRSMDKKGMGLGCSSPRPSCACTAAISMSIPASTNSPRSPSVCRRPFSRTPLRIKAGTKSLWKRPLTMKQKNNPSRLEGR